MTGTRSSRYSSDPRATSGLVESQSSFNSDTTKLLYHIINSGTWPCQAEKRQPFAGNCTAKGCVSARLCSQTQRALGLRPKFDRLSHRQDELTCFGAENKRGRAISPASRSLDVQISWSRCSTRSPRGGSATSNCCRYKPQPDVPCRRKSS